MRRRILKSSVAVAATLSLLVGGDAAAAGWVLPATPLAPVASGPSGAVVAVDPAGDAVAAWTGDDGAGTQSLLVATRPAGGPWSTPEPLARDPGVDAPSVTIDAAGDATVVWVDSDDGSAYVAHAAHRAASGGGWSAAHDFPPVGSADPLTQVRADASGAVVAAWVEHDPGSGVAFVQAAVADLSGTWDVPETVSDPLDASVAFARPQIAPDASGGALVGWTAQRLADPFDFALQTSARSGSGWSAPADLLTTDEPTSPVRLVGTDGGDAAASWFQGSPATLWGALRVGGSWTVDDVSADVAPACTPLQALGPDDGGGATVVWKAQSSDGLESVRLTDGGWEPSVTVFASRTEGAEDAAVDRGTVVLVAHDAGSDVDSLLASRRDAGGGWSAPALLDAAGAGTRLDGLQLARNAAGDALASWMATDTLGAKSVVVATYLTDRPPVDPPPGGPPPQDPPGGGNPPGGTPPPGSGSPPSGGSGSGSGGGTQPTALLRPRIGGAHDGVLMLARGSRTLRLTVRNPNAASLHGSAALVRPRSGTRGALTLASRRKLAFAGGGRRTTLGLQLTDQALRALQRAAGHRLPVRLSLRLRAADHRLVTATLTATLDGTARFGRGSGGATVRAPLARTAC